MNTNENNGVKHSKRHTAPQCRVLARGECSGTIIEPLAIYSKVPVPTIIFSLMMIKL